MGLFYFHEKGSFVLLTLIFGGGVPLAPPFIGKRLHIILSSCRYSKRGQIQLTAVDSEGRTLAMYAIEKQSPQCLNVSCTKS